MRLAASAFVALGTFSAASASACVTIRTSESERKAEQEAFRRASIVVTVEAKTEDYVPMPGRFAGSMRIGVGSGTVIEVHKGPPSLAHRSTNYLVMDGEDPMGCSADAWARPGSRYKLYLFQLPKSAPPMIIYSEMIVEDAPD